MQIVHIARSLYCHAVNLIASRVSWPASFARAFQIFELIACPFKHDLPRDIFIRELSKPPEQLQLAIM